MQPQTGEVGDYLQCASCKLSMSAFDAYFTSRSTEDLLEGFAEYVCDMVIDKTVCQGAVHEMGDIFLQSLAEGVLDPDYFCSEFAGYCSASNYYIFYSEDWVDQLLTTKPESLKSNDYLNKVYDQIANSPQPRKTLKAVQISDPHVDFLYTDGADSQCGGFLCCRENNGFPTDPSRQAGPFGEYKCDLPPRALNNMLEYVRDVV